MAYTKITGGYDRQIAEYLVNHDYVKSENVASAVEMREKNNRSIDYNLLQNGYAKQADVLKALEEVYLYPGIDLAHYTPDLLLIKLLPPGMIRKYRIFPLDRHKDMITIAMADPMDVVAVDEIRFVTGLRLATVVATENQIDEAIEKTIGWVDEFQEEKGPASVDDDKKKTRKYTPGGNEKKEAAGAAGQNHGVDADIQAAGAAPVVRLVVDIIKTAVIEQVSDIHLEPFEDEYRVRYRLDGVLQPRQNIPMNMQRGVISRIKIMSQLDISERRVPQDGHIKIRVQQKSIDLRVSTLPTIYGEKIVMRILDRANLQLDMTRLGFERHTLKRFQEQIDRPDGLILVTGPTGSGKTTTLYSVLSNLNTPEKNIMTCEDPVEYNLPGINQIQVNRKAGFDFANAFRSFFRQNPNVVMLGEIRDRETAEEAVRGALTGYLVLSTLHTNDAPGAMTRLVDMGIKDFMVASSVKMALAQRLLRTVCPDCRQITTYPKYALIEAGMSEKMIENATFYKGRGCETCGGSGYKGRLAIYEIMVINEEIRKLILKHSSTQVLKAAARRNGMKTLREDALAKLAAGISSLEEVLRVTFGDVETGGAV